MVKVGWGFTILSDFLYLSFWILEEMSYSWLKVFVYGSTKGLGKCEYPSMFLMVGL